MTGQQLALAAGGVLGLFIVGRKLVQAASAPKSTGRAPTRPSGGRPPIQYTSNWRPRIRRPRLTARGVYIVLAGQTWQSIAARAKVMPGDLQRLNPRVSGLSAGRVLIIPNPTQRAWGRAIRQASTTAD